MKSSLASTNKANHAPPTSLVDVGSPGIAAALVIGNELLTGKIADANTVVLARTLQSIGVRLVRTVTVLDDLDTIVAEVRALSAAHEVVFTSGGVGPTHDDVTIDAIAAAFDVALVQSEATADLLRHYYGDRLTDGHLRMARVPDGARLVVTEQMPWPTIVMNNVWVLPGIPEIFAMKMPVVVSELGGATAFRSQAVYTNLDEGALKPLLDQVVAAHPNVEVGSYPKWNNPHHKTKITFDSRDTDELAAARATFEALLPADAMVPPPK